MTIEEAKVRLNISEDEDPEEIFEQFFFEKKNYFVSKPIISKLFEVQLNKLENIHEAALVLGVSLPKIEMISIDEVKYSTKILESYNLYEKRRSYLKKLIMTSSSPIVLTAYVRAVLREQVAFYSLWPTVIVDENEQVILAKEPDVMEMLRELNVMANEGIKDFDDLIKSKNDIYVTVWNEMKRVSLLRQKEEEWRKTSLKN